MNANVAFILSRALPYWQLLSTKKRIAWQMQSAFDRLCDKDAWVMPRL